MVKVAKARMRVLVTLKAPRVVVKKIDVFKEKYFPAGFRKIESHITLKPPFDLGGDLERLSEELGAALLSFTPFSMTIEGTEVFHERVLCFKMKGPDELYELFGVVRDLIEEKYKRFNPLRKERGGHEYAPHATVSVASTQKIYKYREEVGNALADLDFLVDGVCLYVWHKGQWHFDRDIGFGK